jgi:hypothetical protein
MKYVKAKLYTFSFLNKKYNLLAGLAAIVLVSNIDSLKNFLNKMALIFLLLSKFFKNKYAKILIVDKILTVGNKYYFSRKKGFDVITTDRASAVFKWLIILNKFILNKDIFFRQFGRR